jgi:hypothetical protein
MARWEGFRQCPGCGFNLATGEGTRSCSWGDCPYVPLELDVYCPNCRYNYMTKEGNPPCGHPRVCEHGTQARANIDNLTRWVAAQPR